MAVVHAAVSEGLVHSGSEHGGAGILVQRTVHGWREVYRSERDADCSALEPDAWRTMDAVAAGRGGLVWTNHKYPAIGNTDPTDLASNGLHGDTSVWNFTPQFGIGVHYFVRPSRSIDVGANAVHVSSASLGDKNPGVNASVQFSLGYSWWK